MAEVLALSSAIASLVTLVGQVSKLSYGFLSDISNAPKSQKMFLQETSALTEVFLRMEGALDVEELAVFEPSSTLSMSLKDCQGLLLSLKTSLEKATEGESRLARAKSSIRWPFSEKEVKAAVERLRRHRDTMVATLASGTFTITVATHKNVDQLTQEKSRERILQWLENPTPPRSSAALRECACPGTGQWLLTHGEYVEWRDGSESLLWCYGHPGVGKTILASIAIDDLHHAVQKVSGSTVLYHFCDLAKRKAATVLQSFLQQIAHNGSSSQLALLGQYCKDSNTPSLKELLRILTEVVKLSYKTWLVIDGLDEFDDRKTLIPIIQRLSKAGVKVLVTSRNIPDIRDAFQSEKGFEVQVPRSELEVYVSNRLEESDLFDSLDPSSVMVSTIVDQADGIFLLARLLMDHLLSCTSVKQMKKALQAMPSNIADAYESTVERILVQPPHRANLATKVIGWISHAERRFKVEELRHALAVEENTNCMDKENLTSTKIVLQVCMGLVFVDPAEEHIHLVHHTAYEYFRRLKDRFPKIQLEMTKTCLTYLGYRTICDGTCSSVEELRHRFENMPLLGYAAQCWGDHARQVEQDMSTQILTLLNDEAFRSSSFQALHYRELSNPGLAAAVFESLPKKLEPLHLTAYWNLDTIGEMLLQDGVDPNLRDGQGWTALHWACSRGSEEMVETLVKHGADIDARDLSGWTPLFWAAIKDHEQIVTRLLQMKANHFLVDQNGWTVLHWTVSKGNAAITQTLLDHHARSKAAQKSAKIWVRDITVEDAKEISTSTNHHSDTETPLEIAADKADIQTFDTILEDLATRGSSQDYNELWAQKGWDNPRTSVPWRIMSKADRFDQKGLKRWDINATSSSMAWKTKLLHGAIRDGKAMIVQLLVELGVDLQSPYKGKTPLQQAALLRDPQIAKILLVNGANASKLRGEEYSPLHLAVARGFDRTVEALLQGGLDVNGKNGDETEETPLMLACEISTPAEDGVLESLPSTIVEMLIDYGADVCATDSNGKNALHIAVAASRPDLRVIRLLLKNEIDPSAINDNGHNPFHTFCQGPFFGRGKMDHRKEETLNLLLAHLPPGVENLECQESGWEGKDGVKETPLAIALKAENWTVFHLLLGKGAILRTTRPLDDLLWKSAWCWALQPKAVRLLIDIGVSVTTKIYGTIPLGHEAIDGLLRNEAKIQPRLEDFQSILNMYIDRGLDVNASDSEQRSLLHKAVSESKETYQSALTQYLLDIGIDPYQPVHGVWDAFLLAAIHGRHQALRVLVSHAAKAPNSDHWLRLPEGFTISQTSDDSLTNLIFASLSHKCLLESPDKSGFTALQKAVSLKNTSAASTLVAYSANIHVTDQYGWTLLHTAVQNGDLETVRVLLDAGASPNAPTLQWAHLSDRPSGLSRGNPWAGTPLHLAAMIGNPAIASLLLEHGADVNADTGARESYNRGHGPTALHIALDTGTFYGKRQNLGRNMLAVAEILVEKGAAVGNAAEHLGLRDVCMFDEFEGLWEKLRAGIGMGKGIHFKSDDPAIVRRFGGGED